MNWFKRILTLGGLLTALWPNRTKKAKRYLLKAKKIGEAVDEFGKAMVEESERPGIAIKRSGPDIRQE